MNIKAKRLKRQELSSLDHPGSCRTEAVLSVSGSLQAAGFMGKGKSQVEVGEPM